MDTVPNIGNVVGNTSPQEFKFALKNFAANVGDLITVFTKVPNENGESTQEVEVWARITDLNRFNPFLPHEAMRELTDENLDLLDTVLSTTRDQTEGIALVLGVGTDLAPLKYPVKPGSIVTKPIAKKVKAVLTGDYEKNNESMLTVGNLIGRSDIEAKLRTNRVVARHMAILAMTGGGKTVAARRILRELVELGYPILILDPHGDYLSFWQNREKFENTKIRLFYPNIPISEDTKDLVYKMIGNMTSGLSDPQKDALENQLSNTDVGEESNLGSYVDKIIGKLRRELENQNGTAKRTIRVVIRQLRIIKKHIVTMEDSNKSLRKILSRLEFEPMPDPFHDPNSFIASNTLSILYLGGYDHLTQSTIAAMVLDQLYEHRATMTNKIPPFMTVIEEAHNFIPSRGEGQAETPSVEVIRKVITEGRKFGTGLLLISQRPSRLDETTLSQCNTFLVFRLVNPRDQSFVEKVMENLSKSDLRMLPGFAQGEGIVSGQAVRFPQVVKIRHDDDLEPKDIGVGNENFVQQVEDWEKEHGSKTREKEQESEDIMKNLEDA